MATISGGASKAYPKFNTIGDSCIGVLIKYEPDVEGTFGVENNATLKARDGSTLLVRCPTVLKNIIEENLAQLTDKVIRPRYTGNGKPKKGMAPAKLFDVDYWPTWEEADAATGGEDTSFDHGANVAATEEAELEAKLAAARARRASA